MHSPITCALRSSALRAPFEELHYPRKLAYLRSHKSNPRKRCVISPFGLSFGQRSHLMVGSTRELERAEWYRTKLLPASLIKESHTRALTSRVKMLNRTLNNFTRSMASRWLSSRQHQARGFNKCCTFPAVR
ncbi:predicted protein [Botrytis cinerea T4]|uniref:Uncharacterized protein n=1 Tax=Botryotinia fuckeliana (strain T4) TaxID=999810 RepID=G2YAS1_BOTF4|nr:predicted protein [Botrytis cinerea T4]